MRNLEAVFVCLCSVLALVSAQFSTDQCYSNEKGCFLQPSGCSGLECSAGVSYRTLPNDPSMIEFELMRKIAAGNTNYVALGLSRDGGEMGDDSVMACMADGASSGSVSLTYNQGKDNLPINSTVVAKNLANISVVNADGVIYCVFQRPVTPPENDQLRVFPLDQDYTLLLAQGDNSKDGVMSIHTLGADLPISSGDALSLTASLANQDVTSKGLDPATKFRLIKSHGCLMIIGWMICATIAILTARYYKNLWPDLKILKIPFWFQVHRTCNYIAVLFIIAGAACIFVAEGWAVDEAHQIVGFIALVLAIAQPIGALFRCHPGTPNRPIFNWLHRIMGIVGWMCAEAAIFLATYIHYLALNPNKPDGAGWTARILIWAFWATICISIITLELLNFMKPKDRINDEMRMKEMNRHDLAASQMIQPRENAWHLRAFLKLIVELMAIGVGVALIIIIAIS